jgi:UDP-N-acetylmuramoylalanine--D-glutamate ligase
MSQRIVILGCGESGVGAAMLAKQKGFEVFVSDGGKIADHFKQELVQAGIDFEEGMHTSSLILNAHEVIKSPGIPEKNEWVQALRKNNISIINEIEFASRYTQAKLICITGTNGKTTTTSLTYHLLKKAGLNVAVAGNIGISMCRMVATGNYDYFVLEISSFQLDDMYQFKADIAILCNITPDHLDRYEYNLSNYISSKFRISSNQQANNLFIYCADDQLTVENLERRKGDAQLVPFSLIQKNIPGAWISDAQLFVQLNENQSNQFTMYTSELVLKGRHNAYNSMAAATVAHALHIRKDIIREGLTDFQNVEHRLEFVATVRGVDFINDSKATNVNSAWYALESMDKPTIWVVGGVDKGNDYDMLKDLVKEKVRMIVCLGLDNTRIHEAFGKDVDMVINTSSAQEAVHVAAKLSKPGETVLLSPACASFDLFKNYEDRGRQFKAAVKSL